MRLILKGISLKTRSGELHVEHSQWSTTFLSFLHFLPCSTPIDNKTLNFVSKYYHSHSDLSDETSLVTSTCVSTFYHTTLNPTHKTFISIKLQNKMSPIVLSLCMVIFDLFVSSSRSRATTPYSIVTVRWQIFNMNIKHI